MPKAPFGNLIEYLRRMYPADYAGDRTDGELLDRFVTEHEEHAFTVLVARHGTMVLGVCQRLLGDHHLAEDAFQATFLVLARRASAIRSRTSLGTWLYTIAQRVALGARAKASATRNRERESGNMPRAERLDEQTWQELRSIIDEEIGRLPEKYQAPLVLCHLEGKSQDKAAKELGCAKGTLARRLARGQELLRQHLVRRGVTLSAVVLGAALSDKVMGAPVAAHLAKHTVQAAVQLLAGKAITGACLTARALVLAEEALVGMASVKGKLVLMVMALGLAIGGAGWGGYKGLAAMSQAAPAATAQAPAPTKQAEVPAKKDQPITKDQYGDPLPPRALARLGTTRLRHARSVSAVTFSRDGKMLISGGWDSMIHIWDSASGREILQIKKKGRTDESIYALALSPDGKTVAAGGWGPDTLWDATTGKQLWLSNTGNALSMAFSPSGDRLAVGSMHGIYLLDAKTGRVPEIKRSLTEPAGNDLMEYMESVNCVAFSPDGKMLASGSKDKTLRLWNSATLKEVRRYLGHKDEVKSLAFSPDGKTLASGSADKTICLWDASSGTMLRQWEGHQYWIYAIAFSRSGNFLASTGGDKSIVLWEIPTGREIRRYASQCGGIMSMAFSPDDTQLAAGTTSNSVQVWDVSTGKEMLPLAGHSSSVDTIAFSPDGQTLASASWDATVRLWDVVTAQEIRRFQHDGGVRSIAFAPGGKTLAATASGESIRQWDIATGKEHVGFVAKFNDINDGLSCSAYSPDGKYIAVANHTAAIEIRDSFTGKVLRTLVGHVQGPVYAIAFSPDGKTLASGGPDKTIRFWDPLAGKEVRRITGHDGWVTALAFSPDGKRLAAAAPGGPGGEKYVRLWDVAAGTELRRFESAQKPVFSIAFSSDGKTLAGSSTGAVRLWEVETGLPRADFEGQDFDLRTVAFSPDGKVVASGSADSTVILWDVTGLKKKSLSPFSPIDHDARWAELASEDGCVAHQAIWLLAAFPETTVPYLKNRLRPAPPSPRAGKLISGLSSEQFAVRLKAAKDLDELGEAAEGSVRQTLIGNPSLEIRRRLDLYLAKREPEVIRKLRAVESLEYIGTSEAQRLFQVLVQESPNPRVIQAASEGLQRLAKRGARTP